MAAADIWPDVVKFAYIRVSVCLGLVSDGLTNTSVSESKVSVLASVSGS